MLFQNLSQLLAYERQHLKFIRSDEERQIVVAIGSAADAGTPLGFKQLTLLHIASSSTITRRLNRLVAAKVIRRIVESHDGRVVRYLLTAKTREAFERYAELAGALNWGAPAKRPGGK